MGQLMSCDSEDPCGRGGAGGPSEIIVPKADDETFHQDDNEKPLFKANSEVPEPQLRLVIELHSAQLRRSFCKIGKLMPCAVVRTAGKEVYRSPAINGHKEPVWNATHTMDSVPDMLDIGVWGKNTVRRDVFCGNVSIPVSAYMPRLERQEFVLEKKQKATGVICVTLDLADAKAVYMQTGASSPTKRTRTVSAASSASSLGLEFDELVDAFTEDQTRRGGKKKTALRLQVQEAPPIQEADEDEGVEDADGVPTQRMASDADSSFVATPILGSWRCTATQGLEQFMIKSGIGMFQRKVALAARWPSWEFAVQQGVIIFVNHSAIGDIREEIPLDKEYDFKDGKGNPWKSKAMWTKTADGGVLRIERKGSLGSYTEERKVAKDTLEFVLTNPGYDASWGRTFQRES
eukprot:TRINITY_DN8901_c0_g1_i1.p1 TRINITY_DN8901_c0_g1~~TRINITY_DN8901_c0_g1_i1.p1  ORF type:complete len:405 (+),score=97.87 TRINITY_DN8901_c0_g1_i1:101-1315(+)